MWKYKKCICKICEEDGGSDIFNSVSEGKMHLFIFHRIPRGRSREFLKPIAVSEYTVKKMWEE